MSKGIFISNSPISAVKAMTRKERTQEIIDRGDVAELLRLAEGYPCGCMGAQDGEPECVCQMNSKQVRKAVSLAALHRGKLVRLRQQLKRE
jgi:hypothetical protein